MAHIPRVLPNDANYDSVISDYLMAQLVNLALNYSGDIRTYITKTHVVITDCDKNCRCHTTDVSCPYCDCATTAIPHNYQLPASAIGPTPFTVQDSYNAEPVL